MIASFEVTVGENNAIWLASELSGDIAGMSD